MLLSNERHALPGYLKARPGVLYNIELTILVRCVKDQSWRVATGAKPEADSRTFNREIASVDRGLWELRGVFCTSFG